MSGIQYQPKLDGLRFIAIFMVLIEHFAYFIGTLVSAGFYGVNLFFVISGFLITSILIKKSEGSFKSSYLKFIGRRSLRIFPIYYMVVIFLILVNLEGIRNDFLYLLTYTYNYRLESTNTWNNSYSLYWSLSVEEQFYIFFPIIVIAFRKNLRLLVVICFGILLIAYSQIFFDVFSLAKYNYVGLLSNMGPLTIGALGAIFLKANSREYSLFKNPVFELLLLAVLAFTLVYAELRFKILICSILNLFLVLKAYKYTFQLPGINLFLANKAIVFIGRISYGIYVYHAIIAYYLTMYVFDPLWKSIPFEKWGVFYKIEFHPWILKFPLYTAITIGIAYLSYKFIEMPFLKLKDKFFAS